MDYKTQAELRRKKILANAEARLRKIRRVTIEEAEKEYQEKNSDSSQCCESVLESKESADESTEPVESAEPLNKDIDEIGKDTEDSPLLPPLLDSIDHSKNSLNGDVCNGLNNGDTVSPVSDFNSGSTNEVNLLSHKVPEKTFEISPKSKQKELCYDWLSFIVLGIFIRILFYVGFSYIFFNNILGPFLVVCVPRIILFIQRTSDIPGYSSAEGLVSLIIFLTIEKSRFKIVLRVFTCLRTCVQFLALYLFSFFITHFMIKELKM